MSSADPVVLRFDDPDATQAPLVAYLHGRGSSEREAGAIVAGFPGATVTAYRGPIAQGGDFAWFLNHGIGLGAPESLADEVPKVSGWIA